MKIKASYLVAFSGVGAALYYVLLLLPGVPILGTPAKMEIGAALSPLFGLVLGPVAGFLAVLIGNTAKTFIPTPNIYGAPFIPAAPLSALAVALIPTRRWWITGLILASLLIASLFAPPFYPVTEYWYVYMIAFYDKIAALVLLPVVVRLLKSGKARYVALYGMFFVAREVDKAFGCFIFALPVVYSGIYGIRSLKTVRSLYLMSPLYYLIEYLIEALVVTIITIPTLRALKRVPGLTNLLYASQIQLET